MGKKSKRLLKSIIASVAAVIVLIVLLLIIAEPRPPKQDPDAAVRVDPTYASLNLSWDKQRGADGYYIYTYTDGKYCLIGETEGKDNCSFELTDYEHDHKYEISVSGYNISRLTGKKVEGKKTEPVEAAYDSRLYAQKIPILTYHKVVPAGTDFDSSLLIAQDDLDRQMKYLHDHGFTTVTPDEFYEWHAGRREFPTKTVMITFDDGYYGVYHLAYPIIKKYGLAATAFCIGHHIKDETEDFDPDAEEEYHIGKDVIDSVREEYPRFSFESHTYEMHTRVDGRKPALVFTYEQIVEDCKKNEQFGFTYLAYPWGHTVLICSRP